MEKPGQLKASWTESSPAVAALSAVRSRRFLSRPDLHRAGFKDSTALVTITCPFHGAGLPKSQAKSAPTSDAPAQSAELIPTTQPIQRVDAPMPEHLLASGRDLAALLEDGAALMESARKTAADEVRLLGFVEAADFAGRVEEISRGVEYLQLVAAQAVERTRKEAQQTGPGSSAAAPSVGAAAAPEWRTGWTDSIDHDGPEPSEETLRQHQGAFLRKQRRYGLHHIEIFATDEQYETLTTVMNTATNPRLTTTGPAVEADTITPDTATATGAATGNGANTGTGAATGNGNSGEADGQGSGTGPDLDRRSRAQKLLNGLVGACNVAMTTGKLPSNGGYRPQLAITIGYQELLGQLNSHNQASQHKQHPTDPRTGTRTSPGADPRTGTGTSPGTGLGTGTGSGTGTATFTGPIHPATIRKIACDADIIPVLLGSDSRVLDIGRTTRIFPPHIRKAITARDQGCTFPDCTMPAPWCEAHHTTYWSHGGTTGTDNGTLLCSHHHHLIHKEQWRIDMKTGVPWFIPPPHIDPHQTPRRNHHHTPHRT